MTDYPPNRPPQPGAPRPDPIEPGTGFSSQGKRLSSRRRGSGRADMVLLMGILSLFLCFPLGIAAWVMAEVDLRKIRDGRLPPDGERTLKVGRAFAILGTLIFAASVVAAYHLVPSNLGQRIILPSSRPLPSDQFAFAGRWRGDRGTLIRIGLDGRGDYKTRNTTVTGGVVRIEGDYLTIGLFIFSKRWHIDKRPHLDKGRWIMELDGETFTRKADSSELVLVPERRDRGGTASWPRERSAHNRSFRTFAVA